MSDIIKLARIQIIVIAIFFIMKKFVRPFVLESDFHPLADIIVYSFPNLCEGIIGVLSATYVLLYLNLRSLRWSEKAIYLIATFLAGVYVITQEFKIHNIGGNNIFDPYDVLFSIIGLLIGLGIILSIKPKFTASTSDQ